MKFNARLLPATVILSLLTGSPAFGTDLDAAKKKHKNTIHKQQAQTKSAKPDKVELVWHDAPAEKAKASGKSQKADKALKQNRNQASVERQLERVSDKKAQRQAQHELDLAEKFLTELDPTAYEPKMSSAKTPVVRMSSVKMSVAKAETVQPLELEKLSSIDPSEEDVERETPIKSAVAKVPASQALNDFDDAQKTLKEVTEEWKVKKAHVKTKDELIEEREENAYRTAIAKATKESAKQNGKPQFVQTPKGKFKVVFVDEKEFADNKPETNSSQYPTEAARSRRAPASFDDQIDKATEK